MWPDSWRVTAVEIDERVAAEYARRYPYDDVAVGDAHAFVISRAHEFDAVWTSPPCPTHSRLAVNVAKRKGVEPEPDPRLWCEVEHLQKLGGRYVVENVHTYYDPPIAPDVVTRRHYYWTSGAPGLLTWEHPLPVSGRMTGLTADAIAESYGLPKLPAGSVPDRRQAMRNAVTPREGLEIALAAFEGDDARADQ